MAMDAPRRLNKAEAEALDAAFEYVYASQDARTARERKALAKRALELSPYCADAHVILAGAEKPDSDKALAHWQAGVAAGKAALGPDFERYLGEFWGFHETRPYMRALFGLAWALWLRGQRNEAILHLQGMLVLNPNDNQGVRYILAAWLIETERDDALATLLKTYRNDDSAAWLWSKALAGFRRLGNAASSRTALRKAKATNAFVVEYLLGERTLPKSKPQFLSPGQRDEAVYFTQQFGAGWRASKGALEWLASEMAASTKQK